MVKFALGVESLQHRGTSWTVGPRVRIRFAPAESRANFCTEPEVSGSAEGSTELTVRGSYGRLARPECAIDVRRVDHHVDQLLGPTARGCLVVEVDQKRRRSR